MISKLDLLQRGELFATLSKIAYYDEATARKEAKKLGFTSTKFYNNDGSQAYQFQNKTDVVIACRGTEPTQFNDIKADLKAYPVKAETISRVHRGFKNEVDDIWPHIEEDIKKVKEKQLWFTGHSLGAAMTTIMSSRCRHCESLADPVEVHTFGSPRVGWKKYTQTFDTKHYRWVNNNDIVTRVPLAIMLYRHDGEEMYLNAYGKLRKPTYWQRVKDRFRGLWMGLKKGKIDSFSDHSIDEYINNIKANKGE